MEETILQALYLKQLQLAFVAACILLASALSIYNLPWSEVEFSVVTSNASGLRQKIYQRLIFKTRQLLEGIGQKLT